MVVLPPWVPENLELERVDFEVLEFREAILQHGRRLWWEGSNYCPCRVRLTAAGLTGSTGENRSDCPGCRGSGIVFDAGQQVVGLVQGVREEARRYNEFGVNATGYVNLTLLPENLPATNDRLTLIDAVRVHTEVKPREGTVETLRFPIVPRTVRVGTVGNLKLVRSVTLDVLHVRATDATGTLTNTVYVKGTHFTVVDGNVDWSLAVTAGTAPPIGSNVSYRYLTRPSFIVMDHGYVTRDLFNRNIGDLELGQHPVHVLAMLEHLGNRLPPVANFTPVPTFKMPG